MYIYIYYKKATHLINFITITLVTVIKKPPLTYHQTRANLCNMLSWDIKECKNQYKKICIMFYDILKNS